MKQLYANFKMNKTSAEIKDYLVKLISRFERDDVNLTLCLPFTSLSLGSYLLSGTSINIGAQNLSDEECGSYTGEISGAMLKDVGVSSVLVGHSERRAKFKENSKVINKKIKIALKNGLGVVLCVGESLTDKNTLKTLETLKIQIEEALKGLYENELERVVIAYEPMWAIGTGHNATVREIEYAAKVIRKVIQDDFSEKAAKQLCVIYGGSLNIKNISSLINAKGIDGALVGGASLDVNNFISMINSIK